MTYRVRRQAITGKLILQRLSTITDRWVDASWGTDTAGPTFHESFVIVSTGVHAEMEARIARYERRAAGARKAHENRKAAQQQKEPA